MKFGYIDLEDVWKLKDWIFDFTPFIKKLRIFGFEIWFGAK